MINYPGTSQSNANSHFADVYGVPLPQGLREQGDQLSWQHFVGVYGRSPGPLRLNQWICLDGDRPAARLGPRGRTYQATIAVGERVDTCTAAASGPVAALTTMLHQRGIAVEMVRFHQFGCPDQTATFVYGSNGRRGAWALGFAPEPALSALHAVIICANRLLMAA